MYCYVCGEQGEVEGISNGRRGWFLFEGKLEGAVEGEEVMMMRAALRLVSNDDSLSERVFFFRGPLFGLL